MCEAQKVRWELLRKLSPHGEGERVTNSEALKEMSSRCCLKLGDMCTAMGEVKQGETPVWSDEVRACVCVCVHLCMHDLGLQQNHERVSVQSGGTI